MVRSVANVITLQTTSFLSICDRWSYLEMSFWKIPATKNVMLLWVLVLVRVITVVEWKKMINIFMTLMRGSSLWSYWLQLHLYLIVCFSIVVWTGVIIFLFLFGLFISFMICKAIFFGVNPQFKLVSCFLLGIFTDISLVNLITLQPIIFLSVHYV